MGKLTHTVSGSIASFKSADKSLIESLKVHFTPIQSGSGDPSPTNVRPITGWNGMNVARSGVNMWNAEIVGGDIDSSGQYLGTSGSRLICSFVSLSTGTYTLSNEVDFPCAIYVYSDADETTFISGESKTAWNNSPVSFTLTGTRYIRVKWKKQDGTQGISPSELTGVQLELGSAATVYESYSGQNFPVTIPAGGKNLCPPLVKGVGLSSVTGVAENGSSVKAASDYIPVNFSANPHYYVSGLNAQLGSAIYGYNANKVFIGRTVGVSKTSADITTDAFTYGTPQGTGDIVYVRVSENVPSGGDESLLDLVDGDNIQLEIGSTATDYEPYTDYLYGGYVDLVTGNIVAEYSRLNVSDITFTASSSYSGGFGFSQERLTGTPIYSNIFTMKPNNTTNLDQLGLTEILYHPNSTSNYKNLFYAYNPEYADISDFSNWFKETYSDGYFIYALETPRVIATLTPTELRAFIGQNSIWSNANGNVECTYELKDHLLKKRRTFMRDHKVTTTPTPVANFKSGIKGGILNSCIVDFSPVQSGTDDPSPTNVRPISGWTGTKLVQHGENLLSINRTTSQSTQGIIYTPIQQNNKTVAVHVTGTRTSTNPFFNLNYVNGTTISIAPGTYKISGGTSEVWIQVFYKDSEGTECIAGYDNGSGATVSVPNDATCSWCRLLVKVDTKVDAYIYPIITSTDAVIMTTPITFPDVPMGKNFFNISTLISGKGLDGYGSLVTNSSRSTSEQIYLPAGTYTVSRKTPSREYWKLYKYDLISGECIGAAFNNTTDKNTFTIDSNCYGRLSFDYIVTLEDETQLEVGSTATDYEPYTNTIYGGTLDLTTGVLTVKLGIANLGDFDYQEYGSTQTLTQYCSNSLDVLAKDYSNCISNIFKRTYSKVEWSVRCSNDAWKFYVCTGKDTYENVNALKSALAEAGAVIVYELATPVTYQLTPVQLKTLLGTNNIWADTNGNISVTYWTR